MEFVLHVVDQLDITTMHLKENAISAELEQPLAKTLLLHINVSLNSNFLVHNVFLFALSQDSIRTLQESASLADLEHRVVPVIHKLFLATQDLTKMLMAHVVLTVHQLDIITYKLLTLAHNAQPGQLFV